VPKPHHVIEDRNVVASIWKNEGGKNGHYYTFSLSKSFTRDNKTEYTTSFGYFDGIRVAKATLGAIDWIARQQNRDKDDSDESSEKPNRGGSRRGKRERQSNRAA